jgi:hypothetical protein
MQYIFIRKYSVFIGLPALKVTGHDVMTRNFIGKEFYRLETKETDLQFLV